MGRRTLAALILAIVVLSLSAFSNARVVCTTTIIGDVVARIAGENADVTSLMPLNADPHAFEPTPRDAAALHDASLVFINGAGLETFLAPLLENATTRTIDLSSNLKLRHLGENTNTGTVAEDATDVDPHVWFDPTNVAAWTSTIADALASIDPANADAYQSRAAAYQSTLHNLDQWITEQIASIPSAKRRMVTDHDAFGYFADRYGVEIVATVFPGLSTMSEPSAKQVAALESTILELGVPVIFVGNTVNPSLAQQVAADTGVLVVFLYTGSLSNQDGPASTYVDFMHYDVQQIVDGLKGQS